VPTEDMTTYWRLEFLKADRKWKDLQKENDALRLLLSEALPCVESEMMLYDSMERMRVMEYDSKEEGEVTVAANRYFDLMNRIEAIVGRAENAREDE
jgi:hypothetical protein